MAKLQPLPDLWLLSDARNNARLELALRRLPRGSAFVYRHYHLTDAERYTRFRELRRIARSMAHWVILSDSALTAREWGADGIYGAPKALYPRRRDMIHVATAHDMREVAQANANGADCVMISPVFATRSHPGADMLGSTRFRTLAARARMPVIALGGMTATTAWRLCWSRWAAIDGLS
ncbi:thiamine phosphate synthase [Altererythrobacter lutimaris]|uniref:Thiamine phosphate synthase n=1 Tax=Altererythrobacter lutimaris TaxID=2743979 RepID=A0A850HCB6_9SPHN|nr:thiamine phosphate synthase [Altererythrobacter lutimaris]NVE95190.1 thiamine phosphate synthase [Altererythrobacter lutimaris]